MAAVMISSRAGLFVGEGKFEEIRDNLDLERWFRLPKSHERRIHSAGSRDLLCERSELLAIEVLTDPLLDLGPRQLPIRLQDRSLAVHPARLNRVEPRALDRKV